MKKFVLFSGFLATATMPILAVISCSSPKEKSKIEQELDKFSDVINSSYTSIRFK